nr:MAG TPA: hypothetical protein [Caudoviricetes sp.]
MSLIDISQKLNTDEESKIKIDAEHEFNVDCGAETMLVAEQKFRGAKSLNDYFEIIKLFLGKEATKIIKEKNLTIKKLNIIVIAIMAQANELSYEEMEERFRNISK